MEFERLKKELLREARKLKACPDGLYKLEQAQNVKQLVSLFFKTLDFSLEHNYPSKELREKFRGLVEECGVFFGGSNIEVTNFKNLALFGNSKGKAKYTGYTVADIYAREDSEIDIEANGNSFVIVGTADNSKVHIKATDTAKVTIIKHGGIVTYEVEGSAKVKIKEK